MKTGHGRAFWMSSLSMSTRKEATRGGWILSKGADWSFCMLHSLGVIDSDRQA